MSWRLFLLGVPVVFARLALLVGSLKGVERLTDGVVVPLAGVEPLLGPRPASLRNLATRSVMARAVGTSAEPPPGWAVSFWVED